MRPPPPPPSAPSRTPRWLLLVAGLAVLALVAIVIADPLGRRRRPEPEEALPKKTRIVAEDPPTRTRPSPPREPIAPPPPHRPPSSPQDVTIVELRVGSGDVATSDTKVTVEYTGTLLDGAKFDETYGRAPFVFEMGRGHVIKGFEQGIDGMRVGGKRRVTIPAALGYGDRAMAKIPAGSTLVFEVELRKVEHRAAK